MELTLGNSTDSHSHAKHDFKQERTVEDDNIRAKASVVHASVLGQHLQKPLIVRLMVCSRIDDEVDLLNDELMKED